VDPTNEAEARPGDGDGPFDPGLAREAVRTLPRKAIVDLLQVSHDPQTVAAYRDAMREGAKFPPISVVRLGGRWIVADGHKRLAAAAGLGGGLIVVEVWPPRRLAADLGRQLLRSVSRLARIVAGLGRVPSARADARRLARDTAVHWGRIARSLWARALGRL
jgi:hypothetical protein